MTRGRTARRGGRVFTLASLAAVVVGLALVAWALVGQTGPPTAPTSVGEVDPGSGESPTPSPSRTPSRTASPTPTGPVGSQGGGSAGRPRTPDPLPLSPPARLRIPSLGVDTRVNPIGKNPDGSLAVPQPGPRLDQAAWFDRSVAPGQPGPSIIEGHVDTESGPSVFYELADLRPGDTVRVTRRDGVVATFTVDALRDVRKQEFPTELVYGGQASVQPHPAVDHLQPVRP